MRVFYIFLFFVLSQASIAQDRPNILFILTDDQRWDALGFAGNEIIQTPEMDRLAAEGVYFSNAFVTTPICAASRASVLTGLYEHRHGYTFGQEFQEEYAQNSYPNLLRNAGYQTAFFGKFGINYPNFSNLFDEGDSYDRNGKFADKRGYFYKSIGSDTVHLTKYTSHQAQEFIRAQRGAQPFVLSLSFSAPHAHDPAEGQFYWSQEFDNLYTEITFPAPLLEEEKYFLDQPEYVRSGENRTRWYWRYDTPEKYQKSMKGYYRMISEIDYEIGKIREVLEEQGLSENTVIILMGDNGYFQGERQLAGKWLMYENSLRVPLIIFDPRTNSAKIKEEVALNIDIAPTILDFAEVGIPKTIQGQSLAGLVKGNKRQKPRDEFYIEHLWKVDIIPASEGIRSGNWKFFRYVDDPDHEELYDLKADPMEVSNLASDENFSKIRKRLLKKLNAR